MHVLEKWENHGENSSKHRGGWRAGKFHKGRHELRYALTSFLTLRQTCSRQRHFRFRKRKISATSFLSWRRRFFNHVDHSHHPIKVIDVGECSVMHWARGQGDQVSNIYAALHVDGMPLQWRVRAILSTPCNKTVSLLDSIKWLFGGFPAA